MHTLINVILFNEFVISKNEKKTVPKPKAKQFRLGIRKQIL